MRLAQPPGVRSCRDGGTFDFCRSASTGGNYVMTEFERLASALASADLELTRQEMFVKLHRAEGGHLDFGTAAESADVTQMEIAPTVLELRLTTRRGEGGDMLIRLYFTEPEERDHTLLGLKLGWKRPGPLGLEEQNRHARCAARRADEDFGIV